MDSTELSVLWDEFSGLYSELFSDSNWARSKRTGKMHVDAVGGLNSNASGSGSSSDDTQPVCLRVESDSVSFTEMTLGEIDDVLVPDGPATLRLKLSIASAILNAEVCGETDSLDGPPVSNCSNSVRVFSPRTGLVVGDHVAGEVCVSSKITGTTVSVLSSLDGSGLEVCIAGLVSVPETLADRRRDVGSTGSLVFLGFFGGISNTQ